MTSYRILPYQLLRVNCRKLVSNGFGLSHIHSDFLSTRVHSQTGFMWGLLPQEHALIRVLKSKSNTFYGIVISITEFEHHLKRYTDWLTTLTDNHFKYTKLPKKEFHIFHEFQFLWLEILEIKDLSHHIFSQESLEYVLKTLHQWKQEYQTESINWSIKNPSSKRVTPTCTNFLQCGGCQLLHVSYKTSLQYKRLWLKEQLESLIKSKKITHNFSIQVFTSSKKENYRNHIQIHINKYKEQGFYMPGTYRVAPFPKNGCLLFEQERMQKEFPQKLELVRCVRVRISDEDILYNELNSPRDKSSSFTYRVDYPLNTSTYITCPNTSFFQVNTSTLPKWLGKIKKHLLEAIQIIFPLQENQIQKIPIQMLELFSGFGFISQMLTQELSMNVLGVDILTKEELNQVYFQREDLSFIDTTSFAENYISCDLTRLSNSKKSIQTKISLFQPNILLLNPPRSGFLKESLDFLFNKILLENQIYIIIYSSCNPATFIRDIENFSQHQYKIISSLSIFDFFPNTSHYEVLAVLKK